MKNRITELEISNFKSIKNIKMDCKRINVLIGKPNVGKSNILEALSFFCDPSTENHKKFLSDYIRYDKLSNLFYDQDRKNQIAVKSNIGFAVLKFNMDNSNSYEFLSTSHWGFWEQWNTMANAVNSQNRVREALATVDAPNSSSDVGSSYLTISDNGNQNRNQNQSHHYINSNPTNTPVKKYQFKSLTEHGSHFSLFLRTPFGDNLFTILESNPKLWNECAGYFNQYGLDLVAALYFSHCRH